jgi:four helix bundle protein
MTYKGYEDLEVWRRSRDVAIETVKAVKHFKDFKIKEQIRDAAFSIPANIAEGHERSSTKDVLRFLGYSKGSASELKTHIQISGSSGLLNPEKANLITKELTEISSMLAGLIKYHQSKLNNPSN